MKILLVCTSGGHFSTMQSLEKFWGSHDRVWVTDRQSDTEVLKGAEKVHWLPYQAPRNVFAFLRGIYPAFKVVLKEKPDMILSTGASIAVNFGLISKILGCDFVYIESISRSQDLSVSGKIVYLLSKQFYVQWPKLTTSYKKAVFKGYV
jgi:beta-1,4-N-acetylglucosaminyltransferase